MLNSNGGRIWKWRKVDVLFLVGVGLMIAGAAATVAGNVLGISLVFAGGGVCGIPFTQRGDKP
jgi:hypothetical protein